MVHRQGFSSHLLNAKVLCYNVTTMMIPEHEYKLEQAGFEPAGPDTWGKLVGEATAFVEVSNEHALAWLYLPAAEKILGPKLRIAGEPDRTVPEALFQLQSLIAQEDACGDVVRAEVDQATVEQQ